MKTKKILILSGTLILALCSIVFWVYPKEKNTPVHDLKIEMSGQQIFNGMFLGDGPALKARPSPDQTNLKGLSNVQKKELVNKMDSYISSEHPKYFEKLKHDFYSKDYLATKTDLLNNGSTYLVDIAKKSTSKNNLESLVSQKKLSKSQALQIAKANAGRPQDLGWVKNYAYMVNNVAGITYVVVGGYGVVFVSGVAVTLPVITYRTDPARLPQSQQNELITKYVNQGTQIGVSPAANR